MPRTVRLFLRLFLEQGSSGNTYHHIFVADSALNCYRCHSWPHRLPAAGFAAMPGPAPPKTSGKLLVRHRNVQCCAQNMSGPQPTSLHVIALPVPLANLYGEQGALQLQAGHGSGSLRIVPQARHLPCPYISFLRTSTAPSCCICQCFLYPCAQARCIRCKCSNRCATSKAQSPRRAARVTSCLHCKNNRT